MGGIVRKGDINATETIVDMADLEPGVYILKIASDKETSILKMRKTSY